MAVFEHGAPLLAVAISPDGRTAASLNYARLKSLRPVVGYAGLPDPYAGQPHPAGDGVYRIDVETAAEMHAAVMQLAGRADICIAAAAVADYRPARTTDRKLKKSAPAITLELELDTERSSVLEYFEIFLDRILETDPRNTEAWLVKGWLRHHCRDDGDAAVGCYRKVISLCGHDLRHPHARRARTSLGRLLASMG